MEGTPVRKSRREPWKLLYNLTTGASTREQVAKPSCKNFKKPRILKNFLSLFRDWDIDSPVSHEKLLCKLAIGGMQLDWLAAKLPEQGNTVFEIYDIFAKTKDFPKTIKTLKNLFVFDLHELSMWNTFNQVQSYKKIWHLLNIDMCDVCGYQNWDSP